MLKLLKAFDAIMSMLPGDGNKTVVAMAMKLLLPTVMAHAPFLLPLMPALEESLTVLIGLGLAHKGAKVMIK